MGVDDGKGSGELRRALCLPEGGAAGSRQQEGRADHSPIAQMCLGLAPSPGKSMSYTTGTVLSLVKGGWVTGATLKARLGCLSCVVFC